MIRSKPKVTTIFSLILFSIIMYGVGVWAWFSVPRSPVIWILLPVFCFVIALIISFKLLLGYRVLIVNGDRWVVKRLITNNTRFNSKDIEWWKEIEIKTATGLFKQLHVHAGKSRNAKVSLQEHTEYQKILNRLRANHGQKEVKERRK